MAGFNPCFRGTCSWCAYDLALDAAKKGFNPCFRGTCSWCLGAVLHRTFELMFQSLFSWNLFLMSRTSSHPSGTMVFQSLFSWNLFLMIRMRLAQGLLGLCFNPCFRGTCSWWYQILCLMLIRRYVSILVFVELVLDVRAGVIKPPVRAWSFNPCFRGTCSWCSRRERHNSRELLVSILVFVELVLDVEFHRVGTVHLKPFQSLFSWNLFLMSVLGT